MAAAAMAVVGCTAKADGGRYTVSMPINGIENGTKAYIVDFDNSEKTDSAVISDARLTFNGEVTSPYMARVIINGQRGPMFIVEPGTITLDDTMTATGTPLNDNMAKYSEAYQSLGKEYQSISDADEAARKNVIDRAEKLNETTMQANIDNPFGAYLFLQQAYDMTPDELNAALEKNPALKNYKRIQKVAETFSRKASTAAGQKFTDFEVEYDGKVQRLSDYAGKGTPVLVDFWASWCGPCRRESAVLKDIYAKYHDKGLEVLGVAVWDEPENTIDAIEDLELPWPQIINAQTIPTDIYGILGIPCIIMIDGEGTILFRDLQGDDLRAAVDSAMNPAPAEE